MIEKKKSNIICSYVEGKKKEDAWAIWVTRMTQPAEQVHWQDQSLHSTAWQHHHHASAICGRCLRQSAWMMGRWLVKIPKYTEGWSYYLWHGLYTNIVHTIHFGECSHKRQKDEQCQKEKMLQPTQKLAVFEWAADWAGRKSWVTQTERDLAALAVSGQVEVEIPFMCEKHTFFVMYMAILSFILHPYSLT